MQRIIKSTPRIFRFKETFLRKVCEIHALSYSFDNNKKLGPPTPFNLFKIAPRKVTIF
jgi:hypothetical protein